MVESLQYGLSTVAHTALPPTRPEWRAVDARVMRYDYEPQRAMRMIEDLGYARGGDGFFRDDAGNRLSVELRSTASTTLSKAQLSVADYWQRAGVAVDAVPIPQQLVQDREYRARRSGFQMAGTTLDPQELTNFHSARIPRSDNNYIGTNDALYSSPEYDRLVDRYVVTIPEQERNEVLAQMAAHLAENLPLIILFYDVEPTMVANRLQNVRPRRQPATQAWNIHEWELN
jgi:peptide/nickel transport system substrate-binding protein